MRTSAFFALAAILVTSAASVASAKPVALPAVPCSVVDVSFRGSDADQCYGEVVGTNDSLPLVNSLGVFGGGWEDMIRDGGDDTRFYAGVNWTLSADVDDKSGDWQLRLQDPAPANLPLSVDFMVVLKGGHDWSGYLFSAEKFYPTDLVNNGAFAISFKNGGGNIPELSHMSLYFRDGASFDCSPTDPKCVTPDPNCVVGSCPRDTVPEPTSMALLGLGLLGAGVVGRRRA